MWKNRCAPFHDAGCGVWPAALRDGIRVQGIHDGNVEDHTFPSKLVLIGGLEIAAAGAKARE